LLSSSKKSLPIQKTYEALFALEDIREIFRHSRPTSLDERQQDELSKILSRIKSVTVEIEAGEGRLAGIVTFWDVSKAVALKLTKPMSTAVMLWMIGSFVAPY